MNTPTEYFGPHAKRWTHPRTGVTYSLKPRDYHQLVAEEKEKVEAAAVEYKESLIREDESSPVVPPEMAAHYDAIVYGATRGGIKYPTPEERVAEAQAAADTAFVAARIAEDARDRALADAGDLHSAYDPELDPANWERDEESLVRGRIHSATLSHDGMGHVSTSSSEPAVPVCPQEQPAAHHLRERLTSPRFWVTLGLVYIIAIIGVTAVTGVIS